MNKNRVLGGKRIGKIIDIWSRFLVTNVVYLPILGPVYVNGGSVKKVLYDLLKSSRLNKFLPYDKNKRWFKNPPERIVGSDIQMEDGQVLIPIESHFNKKISKIFYYGSAISINHIIKLAKNHYPKLIKSSDANSPFVYYFHRITTAKKKKPDCYNIYLKLINSKDKNDKEIDDVICFNDLPQKIRKTLFGLGKETDLKNFAFLWEELTTRKKSSSSLICAVEKSRIIGAIGPLSVTKDAWDKRWLLPPNFGVKKSFRRMGYGEILWRSAMDWSYRNGVKYTLVQAGSNSPAAKFYAKQELKKMTTIYRVRL